MTNTSHPSNKVVAVVGSDVVKDSFIVVLCSRSYTSPGTLISGLLEVSGLCFSIEELEMLDVLRHSKVRGCSSYVEGIVACLRDIFVLASFRMME